MSEKSQATSTGMSPATSSILYQSPKGNIHLIGRAIGTCAAVFTVLLAACSPTTSTPNPAPTSMPPSLPTSLPTSAASNLPNQSAPSTPLDPCVLITSQEAGTIAGTTFGTGLEGSISAEAKTCTYGSQTTNVFFIEVAQAPDIATAQADKAQFLADLQANLAQLTTAGLNITELPNFADGATMATVSISTGGETINGGAIGFLKGTIFFGFSDEVVGNAAPGSAALQAEATTVLGRLP